MPVQSFHLAQHQRARVWSGEYPDAPLGSGPVLGDCLAAGASDQAEAKTVAIEWLVPLGGYSMYALLGGTIRPQPKGVTLQVVTSPAPIAKF